MSLPYSTATATWGLASNCEGSEYGETVVNDEQTDFKLPHFKVFLFATILEDAITKLRILEECNTELKINKTILDMVPLLRKKHHVKEKASKDELDNVDPKRLNCLEYSLKKLEEDRAFIFNVLKNTYLNLTKTRQFHNLSDAVFVCDEKSDRLDFLIAEEAKHKQLYRDLSKQLRQQRNHFKLLTYEKNNVIDSLRSNLQDAELKTATCCRYVEGWQRSREEQHAQIILDKESAPFNNIEMFKTRIEREQHVHSEVELLFNIKIQEVIEKVEGWMKKYDTDMEKIDLNIQKMMNLHERTNERRIRLEKMLEDHAVLASNWIKFKEEREAARLWREKMYTSAIIIQAWWRGLLVRNQLGPYKVLLKRKRPAQEEKQKKK